MIRDAENNSPGLLDVQFFWLTACEIWNTSDPRLHCDLQPFKAATSPSLEPRRIVAKREQRFQGASTVTDVSDPLFRLLYLPDPDFRSLFRHYRLHMLGLLFDCLTRLNASSSLPRASSPRTNRSSSCLQPRCIVTFQPALHEILLSADAAPLQVLSHLYL